MSSQLGFLCRVNPALGGTPRNLRDDLKENLRTEYLKAQLRHFLIELFRPSGARANCAQTAVPSPE